MFPGRGAVYQNPSCPEAGKHFSWRKAVGRAGCFLLGGICSDNPERR